MSQHNTVTVEVFAPKEVDGKTFTFLLSLTVGVAAGEAAIQFGYAPGTTATFKKDTPGSKAIDPKLTLEAAHIHNGEKLALIDLGGGV